MKEETGVEKRREEIKGMVHIDSEEGTQSFQREQTTEGGALIKHAEVPPLLPLCTNISQDEYLSIWNYI